MSHVTTEELEPAIEEAFSLWVDHDPERNWARTMWAHLTECGLTEYDNELERHLVLSRFLALASVYLQFWDIMAGESWEVSRVDWLASLETSGLRLGQILGPTVEDASMESIDDDELQEEAWLTLEQRHRPEVVGALTDRLGSWENLYESLFWSAEGKYEPAPESDDDEDDPPVEPDPWDASIMSDNPACYARARAAIWIMEGCSPDEVIA